MKFVCKLILFFLFFVITTQNAVAQDDKIRSLRLELQKARNNKDLSERLYQDLSQQMTKDVNLVNCQATSSLLQGLHSKNITLQNKYISEALVLLNQSLEIDSNNLEAHVLRFSVETELPFFYYKRKHIQEDANFLGSNFKQTKFSDYSFRYVEEMYHILERSQKFTPHQLLKMKAEVISFGKELAKN